MGMNLNGYKLEGELSSRNAGFSQWGYCRKNGRDYFIKAFLNITYPEDNSELSPRIIARKRKLCEAFYEEKRAFYDALSRCRSGNNVVVEDFFLSGSKYYAVTDKIDADGTDPAIIATLPPKKRERFLRALLYSVSLLHAEGIVHSDLKPGNILLKPTAEGCYAPKIVDFDAGFFKDKLPAELQGDFVYLSPEVYRRMKGEKIPVDEKADIFALGLLFHQYWTGELPAIGENRYAFEAVLSGETPALRGDLPDELRACIGKMLSKDAADRPGAAELLERFRAHDAAEPGAEERQEAAAAADAGAEEKEPKKVEPPRREGFFIPDDLG